MKTEKLKVEPIFVNGRGKSLSLKEIMKQNIISISVAYLATESNLKVRSFNCKLRIEVNSKFEKILTINDEHIILYYSLGNDSTVICFQDKNEFDKITDYDEGTLWKMAVSTVTSPYHLSFHQANLRNIDWD